MDGYAAFLASFGLFLLSSSPAMAEAQTFEPINPFSGVQAPGQWVTLFLFLLTVPGGCRKAVEGGPLRVAGWGVHTGCGSVGPVCGVCAMQKSVRTPAPAAKLIA